MWAWIAGGLAAVAGTCLLRSEYEKKHFSVEHFIIESEKIKKPVTFVFLSDLHDNEFGQENRLLVEAIEQVRPDAVLIGGDMMVCKGGKNIDTALVLLRKLAARFPVYYGNGNHENRMDRERDVYGNLFDKYQKELKKIGIKPLYDTHLDFGDNITIYGIDIGESYYKKMYRGFMEPAYVANKLGNPDRTRFNILLAHSPMFFDTYREWGADLSLSGHFHGGTIRLPWLGGVMTPQLQFFLPWCAGLFQKNGRSMVVSRGLGTHSINIRLNNKPQLVVIELKQK